MIFEGAYLIHLHTAFHMIHNMCVSRSSQLRFKTSHCCRAVGPCSQPDDAGCGSKSYLLNS
jgi:hypothetical protein